MTDIFPAIALGDALDESQANIIPVKCGAAVTKGQVVKPQTHTSGEICSVQPATADCLDSIGVALKNGAAGDVIPVLTRGIAKVTAAAAITMGTRVTCAANGQITAYPGTPAAGDDRKVVGIALQTFAAADEGLIEVF